MIAFRASTLFRFAIADDTGDDEIGVIESGALGVQERVPSSPPS
jgi:hypothetical protein